MRWFAGFRGRTAAPRHPKDKRGGDWVDVPGVWTLGEWDITELLSARRRRPDRSVVVFGRCGIKPEEVNRLALNGVPDDVAWRWPGSYVVAEITNDVTHVWTDLASAVPIYTYQGDEGVYWASSSRALAGLDDQDDLVDMDLMVSWLAAPFLPIASGTRSFYCDVRRVPAGHRLTITAEGAVSVTRVWNPQPAEGRDHAEELLATLAGSVLERLVFAKNPTVDLSGGYDSSALAILAATSDKTIGAVTMHPERVITGGDLEYAHVVGDRPNIDHRLMPLTSRHAPYSNLAALPPTDEPAPSTVAYTKFAAQLQWLRAEFNSDCHMTGDGGDSILWSRPLVLADLIAAQRYRRVASEAASWAKVRGFAIGDVLASAYRTSTATYNAEIRHLAEVVQMRAAGKNEPVQWFPRVPAPPWLSRSARGWAGAVIKEYAEQGHTPEPGRFAEFATTQAIAEIGRTARADVQLAEFHGVELHNPYTDSQVINACLSVPLHQQSGPAEYKSLLREAMRGKFPDKLLTRRTKGDFNADHFGGMRANLKALHELADGRLAEAHLIDVTALRQTMTRVAAGVEVPYASLETVVAAEAWLRTVQGAARVQWTPTNRIGKLNRK